MMACGQIVNLAWREGLEEREVTTAYGEAIDLAQALRDARALVLITLAYGRFLAACGSADEYLAQTERALAVPEALANKSLKALLTAVRSHALMMTGYVGRALETNDDALASVQDISPGDLQTMGYNVEHWLIALRARLLLAVDELAEARRLSDMLLAGAYKNVDMLHRVMASAVAFEIASLERRTGDIKRHIDFMEEAAREVPTAYLRVNLLTYRAASALSSNDAERAKALYLKALRLVRGQRAGLEREPHILLGLAEAESQSDIRSGRELLAQARAVAHKRAMRLVEGIVVGAQLRIEPNSRALRADLEVAGSDHWRLHRVFYPARDVDLTKSVRLPSAGASRAKGGFQF